MGQVVVLKALGPDGAYHDVACDNDGNLIIPGIGTPIDDLTTQIDSLSTQITSLQSSVGSLNTTLGPGTNVHGSDQGAAAKGKYLIISDVPCKLRSIKAQNSTGADYWLMLFDATSLPADSTAWDRLPIPVAAGDVNGDAWEGGTVFANGCVAALSSTSDTLTLIDTNNARFDAEKIV